MSPNDHAPVHATCSIMIEAPIDQVWEILTDFQRWPSWNPDVRWIKGGESVQEGMVFKWRTGGSTVRSKVQKVERPVLIIWSGSVVGIKKTHAWALLPKGDRTLLNAEEASVGFVARLFRGSLQNMLDISLPNDVRALKAEAERKARK